MFEWNVIINSTQRVSIYEDTKMEAELSARIAYGPHVRLEISLMEGAE